MFHFGAVLDRKNRSMAKQGEIVDMVGGAHFISVADVQSAYRQSPLHPNFESTAFVLLEADAVWCLQCSIAFYKMAQKNS